MKPKPLTDKDFVPMANILTKQRDWKRVTEKERVLSAVEGLKQEFKEYLKGMDATAQGFIDKWFPVAKGKKR